MSNLVKGRHERRDLEFDLITIFYYSGILFRKAAKGGYNKRGYTGTDYI